MLVKKKEINYKIFSNIKNILSKIIFSIGLFFLSLFFILIFYYYTSGLSKRFPPVEFIKNVDRVILDRHIGFSIFKIDDYLKLKLLNLKYKFINNDLENITIKIDQENLYILELQRQQRLGKISKSQEDLYNFSRGEIILNNEKYPIKLRVKGDRLIHWYDKNRTSYKVDLRGSKRIWGLEEFSVQKPITRNYTYEFIFHKLLEFNKLISLKYFFINLSLNDTNQGVYAVEEGFSKELIERNKRRNGPIFGVDEEVSDYKDGVTFPNILFDLYSKKYWLTNYPELTEKALLKLNSFKKKEVNADDIFDLEKWATYFAIIDFSNAFHGAIVKSVKFYYNPVTAKFEPIGFDGHISTNYINDFLLLDFLDPNNKNCEAICYDKNWFLSFLRDSKGNLNERFVNLYLKELKRISSDKFLKKFNLRYSKDIEFFNNQIYSDNSKTDQGGLYEGLGPYVYDKKFLSQRSNYIKSRLKNIDQINQLQYSLNNGKIIFDDLNKTFFKKLKVNCINGQNKEIFIFNNLKINYDENCNYFVGTKNLELFKNIFILSGNTLPKLSELSELNGIEYLDDAYYLNNEIVIKKNFLFSKDKKLIVKEGAKIKFESDSVLVSEGSIFFEGSIDKPVIIDGINGKGSIILSNNKFKFKNVIVQNLSFPKDENRILYGGINVINSELEIKDTKIINSNSEDAINIISSISEIKDLTVKNIEADAIDIDFGKINFQKILCENISNDCFDASGAHVNGSFLTGNNIYDKGLSFGENSIGKIFNIDFQNTRLGIAVKDGSKLKLSKYKLANNDYDLAVFNKKNEYDSSLLNISDPIEDNKLKFLIGYKNDIIKDNIYLKKKIDNKKINELFYQ